MFLFGCSFAALHKSGAMLLSAFIGRKSAVNPG